MGTKHVPVSRIQEILLKNLKNYRDAMKDLRGAGGIAALERNDTWEVIKKPRNAKLLHNKWVFKLKTHADGPIERYKARLVARGDQPEYGVNHTYTFSTVLDLTSGRLILVVARKWGVPSAFVKADKEAEIKILLCIPLGMEISQELLKLLDIKDKRELALRLKKGLYSLK
ncbi:Pol Polyprotein, partial [Phytophthora megakarya]